MNKKNFAILISTSDNYLDVLDLFLEFFVKNNITRIPIYINTETKLINEIVFKFSNLNLIPINYNKLKFLGFWFDWSNRLKDALKSIDEEYILHLLDDFFYI